MDPVVSHNAIVELLGAYALDAVDPAEAATIRDHLVDCPRCRDEVSQHQQTAAMLAATGNEAPAAIWDAIATTIERPTGVSAPFPPLEPVASRARRRRRRRARTPLAMLA